MFEPCPTFNDKHWYISFKPDKLMKDLQMSLSYQLFAARLLGFSYPDYLRYGRSKGARIIGRDGLGILIFDKNCDAINFCKELNDEYVIFTEALQKEGKGKSNENDRWTENCY